MIRTANISSDEAFRFRLSREWGDVRGLVCWVMLNPSTADGAVDDPTIRKCIRFAKMWHYDGIVVVNLYPLRATKPADCKPFARWWEGGSPDWWARDKIQLNETYIEHAVAESSLVIAAWGARASRWDPGYVQKVSEELLPDGTMCLGRTKDGSPRHPLMLAYETRLERLR